MKKALKLLSSFLCLLFIYSCNSVKFATGVVGEENIKVRQHIANNEVPKLIEDYNKTPQCRDEICRCLFGQIDYTGYSYSQLQNLRNSANYRDSVLFHGFNDIIIAREVSILEDLEQKTIKDVVAFCKQHQTTMPFLRTYLDSTIIANIPSMDYKELKYCANIFDGTSQGAILRQAQKEYKNNHKKEIEKEIDKYLSKEKELLNYLEYALEMYVYTNAYASYPLIMQDIFKGDMPNNNSDCNMLVQQSVDTHFSASSINSIATSQISSFFEAINESRRAILFSNKLDGEGLSFSPIYSNNISLGEMAVGYNMSPIYKISEIDNETTLTGYAMQAVGFFGGVLGSAAKFAYDVYKADEKGEKAKPYIESFVKNYGNRIKQDCDTYINNIMKQAQKTLLDSQSKFKKQYYETY